MATTVEKTKTIDIEGERIEMRPLKIKRLRVFMRKFDALKETGDDNDKSLDVMLELCAIAMEQHQPELADVERLEEILDIDDIYLIVEASSGIKLGDSGN